MGRAARPPTKAESSRALCCPWCALPVLMLRLSRPTHWNSLAECSSSESSSGGDSEGGGGDWGLGDPNDVEIWGGQDGMQLAEEEVEDDGEDWGAAGDEDEDEDEDLGRVI